MASRASNRLMGVVIVSVFVIVAAPAALVPHPVSSQTRSISLSTISLPKITISAIPTAPAAPSPTQTTNSSSARTSSFYYSFNTDGILEESGSMSESKSQYWWLNSGGELWMSGGTGKTIQGELSRGSKWQVEYQNSNPVDTDNGYHPQNIFRLVTRSQWRNESQQVYFKIAKDNLSASPNRNASNGLFLMNRYVDGNNLYYVGLRVDGAVVVKKKKNGVYSTLEYKQIFSGAYNRDTNPNLLPKQVWLGLKNTVTTDAFGNVKITVFMDQGKIGVWTPLLTVVDSASKSPIVQKGYGGIRTDFMDVEFDDYSISSLSSAVPQM